MDWKKNKEIIDKFEIKRGPIDYILPVLIVILFCYVLTLVITLIAGQWFNLVYFVDTVQRIAGAGVALSLLAFLPRLIKAKNMSDNTGRDKEMFYRKSELKSKLESVDIIVFLGSLLTIGTSLLLTPMYKDAMEQIQVMLNTVMPV